ncbi:DUF4404 family protein [Thalassoglobus polymorphus]|uniref:DUF4404 domain-containing protein n=1 Tax=Thalassoglobus polymorphus TaxID=2527994 RepID=A0A517QNX3_9PLAN|nr:DUF4404 family protein [Thalassoglobus polymorphus]QDT33312.1 hypothetical protein Mal48_25650 [Thalassoglobus polymorphus]
MEREQLKQTLSELHQELAESPDLVDTETKALIQQLATDIQLVCTSDSVEPGEKSEPVQIEKEGVLDQLLSLTDEFEESYPKLAEAIGRVATALSRIGI